MATFATVAAVVAVAVAGISYVVVRDVTLRGAQDRSVSDARVHLDDAATSLPASPSVEAVRQFVSQVEVRSAAQVVAFADGAAVTTSVSLRDTAIPAELVTLVDEGRVGAVRTDRGGDSVLVVGGGVRPAGPTFYFFYDEQGLVDDLALLARVLAATSGLLVLVSALVGAAAASGVLRPIGRTRAAVRAVAAGDLDARLVEDGGDELAELAQAFNAMTAALRRTVGELRDLEAGQRRFVSDVSHELRTPLTALTTACEVLEANTDGLSDSGQAAARLVVGQSRRLAALVEDLMEISRMDAGAAEMTLERVDVSRAVSGAVRSRGWGDDVEVRGGDGVAVLMDARRFDAIIGNLVGNARTYGRPPVTVTVRTARDAVEVAVADRGDGIAPHHLERVFDRFYKVDRSRSAGGTGLGLAIARENARLHGGDLSVLSEPGDGATFTLRLPRTPSASSAHVHETDRVER